MKKLMLAMLAFGLSANAVLAEEAVETPTTEVQEVVPAEKKDIFISIEIEGSDVTIVRTEAGFSVEVTDSYVETSNE